MLKKIKEIGIRESLITTPLEGKRVRFKLQLEALRGERGGGKKKGESFEGLEKSNGFFEGSTEQSWGDLTQERVAFQVKGGHVSEKKCGVDQQSNCGWLSDSALWLEKNKKEGQRRVSVQI